VQLGTESGVGTLGEWVHAALESGDVPRGNDGTLRLPPARKE
jgi:hypothetical protein